MYMILYKLFTENLDKILPTIIVVKWQIRCILCSWVRITYYGIHTSHKPLEMIFLAAYQISLLKYYFLFQIFCWDYQENLISILHQRLIEIFPLSCIFLNHCLTTAKTKYFATAVSNCESLKVNIYINVKKLILLSYRFKLNEICV